MEDIFFRLQETFNMDEEVRSKQKLFRYILFQID